MISDEEIKEISKKTNLSENEVKKRIEETLNSICKPSLTDICYPDFEKIGIGPSK